MDKVDKEKIKGDPHFPLGMPKSDNASYLWIVLFYSALNARGQTGFVMANSAADSRLIVRVKRIRVLMSGPFLLAFDGRVG